MRLFRALLRLLSHVAIRQVAVGIGLAMTAASQAWAGVAVSLTAPSASQVYPPGGNIALTATASASGGYSVSKVEFFRGATLIGTDTTAPYSFSWNNVPAGNYAVTAKATAVKSGSPNQTATSAVTSVRVTVPPTVSLVSPTEGSVFPFPGGTVTLQATASDSDGTIVRVDFEILGPLGETQVISVNQPPYTAVWEPFPTVWIFPHPFNVTAFATDNHGAFTASGPVAIWIDDNEPPSVSITSPASNATFNAPASIPLQAQATDSDGTISSVAFYHGTTLITTLTAPPYSFNWIGVAQGAYSVTARAADNLGTVTTSAPVSITVNAPVPPTVFGQMPKDVTLPGSSLPFISAQYSSVGSAIDLDSVQLRLNGQVVAATAVPSGVFYQVTQPLAVATHSVSITAANQAGASTTDSWSFTVDDPAPNFYSETPRDVFVADRRPRIRVLLSGFNIVPASVRIEVDNADVTSLAEVATDRIVFTPVDPLGDGLHQVSVSATDGRGAIAGKQWTFTVELPPPPSTTEDGTRTVREVVPEVRVLP
jgi:hypothetical protein